MRSGRPTIVPPYLDAKRLAVRLAAAVCMVAMTATAAGDRQARRITLAGAAPNAAARGPVAVARKEAIRDNSYPP